MLHKKQNEQDARVMDIVFEVMALFFIIANNFSTNILNCDMQRVLTRNVLMSHIITLGILYNLVLKVYKPKMSDVELLFKVVTVCTAFYVLNGTELHLLRRLHLHDRQRHRVRARDAQAAFDNASTIVLTDHPGRRDAHLPPATERTEHQAILRPDVRLPADPSVGVLPRRHSVRRAPPRPK